MKSLLVPCVSICDVASNDFDYWDRFRGPVDQGRGRAGGNKLFLDQLDCFLRAVVDTHAQEEFAKDKWHFSWPTT